MNKIQDKSTQVDYVVYIIPEDVSYYLSPIQYKPTKHNYERKPHIIKAR